LVVQESVSVQESMAGMVNVLVSTTKSAFKLFSTTAVNDHLQLAVGTNGTTSTLFSSMYTENSNAGVLYSYLPDSIKHSNPKLISNTPIPPNEILILTETWVATLKSSIHQRLITLFGAVKSGIELVNLQKHITSLPITFDIETVGKISCMSSQSVLWREFIEDSYLNRCDALIKESFGEFFNSVEAEMKSKVHWINTTSKELIDGNVAQFVWNQKIDGSKPVNSETLVATPSLRELGDFLDLKCGKVSESLKPLLADVSGPMKSYSQILSKFVHMDFISILQDYCRSVTKMLNAIESSKIHSNLTLQTIYIGRSVVILKDKLINLYQNLCSKDNLSEINTKISSEIQSLYAQSHKSWLLSTSQVSLEEFLDSAKRIQWDNCDQFIHIWEGIFFYNR
jgi:hypothetical protein